jgi:hypothetical protein
MLAAAQNPCAFPQGESDPVLAAYLGARSPAEIDAQLARLLTIQADPLIAAILRARQTSGGSVDASSDAEDTASATRERLIGQLGALRDEARAPIRDFRAYVATTTYTVWAESLRARHPQRALFLNRLRYLLENRTAQKGFAIWQDAGGTKWCGLSSWGERPGQRSPKYEWLIVDPVAAAREAVGGVDPARLILADVVARVFRWLGGPMELRDLTNALVELPGVVKTPEILPNEQTSAIDPRQSPAEDLIWKEYLGWLWRELNELSERQRRAFLFHSEVLREFELLGIASIRSIAGALLLSAQELAELWNRIPLDDLTIAPMLGCTRQQVINLRRVARDNLSEAWRAWRFGAGNIPPQSSS